MVQHTAILTTADR